MLENEDINRLKEIFVTVDDCNENVTAINGKIADFGKEMAVITTQLKLITWFAGAAGTAAVSMAVKYLFGG